MIRFVILLAAICFAVTLQCAELEQVCDVIDTCCGGRICTNGRCKNICNLEGQNCGPSYGSCCQSLVCSEEAINGICEPSPNHCRYNNTRCTDSVDASFWQKCCDGFLCEDANGSPNSGTCKDDPNATPATCHELHATCDQDRDCCDNRKCVLLGSSISGVCRDSNETEPYCHLLLQRCTNSSQCCSGSYCLFEDGELMGNCEPGEDPNQVCMKELFTCSLSTGYPCCNGLYCNTIGSLYGNGQCEPVTTATEKGPSSTVAPTTTKAATTTVNPPFCAKQNDACLLGVLLKTCCPGLRCSALVLGTCIPV